MHQHKAVGAKETIRGWTHCVTPVECAARPERQAAHGNIIITDTCRCGATRLSESNCTRRNYAAWQEPQFAPQLKPEHKPVRSYAVIGNGLYFPTSTRRRR